MSAFDLTYILIAYVAAINALTFAVCIYDRYAAKKFWRRVPEKWLLILSVLGGVPAAKLMQIICGHKKLREEFTLNLNLIAVFHLTVGVAAWSTTTPLVERLILTEVEPTAAESETAPAPSRFGPGS